jgi:hypothetical protein
VESCSKNHVEQIPSNSGIAGVAVDRLLRKPLINISGMAVEKDGRGSTSTSAARRHPLQTWARPLVLANPPSSPRPSGRGRWPRRTRTLGYVNQRRRELPDALKKKRQVANKSINIYAGGPRRVPPAPSGNTQWVLALMVVYATRWVFALAAWIGPVIRWVPVSAVEKGHDFFLVPNTRLRVLREEFVHSYCLLETI